MRLTQTVCRGRRIYRDVTEKLFRQHWHRYGARLGVDRFRVHADTTEWASTPTSRQNKVSSLANGVEDFEDMFYSRRYNAVTQSRSTEKVQQQQQQQQQVLASDSANLRFVETRRFTKDLDQASLLTNAAIIHGRPPGLAQLDTAFETAVRNLIDVQREDGEPLRLALERALLHAHVWRTDETCLPRRYRANLPIWKHKIEFGNHPVEVTRQLWRNLFHVLRRQSPSLLGALGADALSACLVGDSARRTFRDRVLDTSYSWGAQCPVPPGATTSISSSSQNGGVAGRRIRFKQTHDVYVAGRQPLPCFVDLQQQSDDGHWPPNWLSSGGDVVRSVSDAARRLGPMSPLIDLTVDDDPAVDPEFSTDGWIGPESSGSSVYSNPHLMCINFSLPNAWSDFLEPEAELVRASQRQAIGVMHCLAACLAALRRSFRRQANDDDVSSQGDAQFEACLARGDRLTKPLCTQAVVCDGVNFDFVAFQLNTLAFPDSLQMKNPSTSTRHGFASSVSGTDLSACNLAWVWGDVALIEKRVPMRSMLRNTAYRDLQPDVFARLASTYHWPNLAGWLATASPPPGSQVAGARADVPPLPSAPARSAQIEL